MALDGDVDPKAVDQNDSWLALHERARDLRAADANGEKRGVPRSLRVAPLLDHEATRPRDRERVHQIHALGAERLEETLHDRSTERLGVELEKLAGVCKLELRG